MQIKEIIETIKHKLSQSSEVPAIDKNVAAALGFSPAYLATAKSRGTIPYEQIINLCDKNNWDLNEVLLGKAAKNNTNNDNTVYEIDFLDDTFASCGAGGESYSSKRTLKLDKAFLETLKPSGIKYNIEAIRASGDSMESTIADGSIVLVDKNDTNFSRSGVFVLRTEGGILIKRLSKNVSGDISVVSDNSVYHTDIIKANELMVIGRVLGSIKRV